MRPVLSVTSECAPLIKTGGLADVAGALPAALSPEGWELRTLLPGYPGVKERLGKSRPVTKIDDLFGGPATVRAGTLDGARFLVLDAPHLYDRPGGPYTDEGGKDWPDNPVRFAALCRVAAQVAGEGVGKWRPEVVHCHDWQAGFAPVYLSELGDGRPGSVMTIHNMAFLGMAPAAALGDLRLPPAGFHRDGFEFWGDISALKAGLTHADRITTVSPSYARELLTPEYGAGLDGLMRARSDVLTGILNGIDLDAWNPATDPAIETYRSPGGKKRAKRALRAELDLPEAEGPLCVVVSRLSAQKGLDVLLDALPALVDRGGQLALLGSGDPGLEDRYRAAAAAHPNVAVRIGYDEALAHRIIAGGDAIVIPSRFEPCGLTQLYGLRYGTVPVVAYTGGLIDTVIPATPMGLRAGAATGIQFHPVTAQALAAALTEVVTLHATPRVWSRLQKNGMATPVGWEASAPDYAALYEQVARG